MPWEFLEEHFHSLPASGHIKERPSSVQRVFVGHPLSTRQGECHLNDRHAAVIKRGKRNLMCCKEDAVKGLQRWSMQTRDTLEMVSRWVPGLGPKWRRGCRRTRWTQKKKQCITLSAVTLMIFKHHTEICERGAQDRQKTQALTIRVRLSCLKTGREFASLRCNWKNGGMVELLWYYVCSESF